MSRKESTPRVTRRRFLGWSALAAASAGLAPLLSACSQPAAPAPAAQPTAAPAAPSAAPTKAAAAPTTPAKVTAIELKFDHHEPAQGHLGRTYQQYADTVNKDSGGRLHITVYAAETLTKAADAYSNCVNGVNDMAWTGPGYVPGQFKLSEGFNLPMLGIKSGRHGARAFTEWYKTTPALQKEWEQVHVLTPYCNGVGYIYTTKKQLRSVEDAAGLRIRATGFGPTNLMKIVNANPVPTSVPESFEALSKGILDAGVYDWQAVNSQHLYEHLKFFHRMPVINSPQILAFNKKKWNSIPADLQKILEFPPSLVWQTWDPDRKGKPSSLGEFYANGFDVADKPGEEEFKKNGGTFLEFPPEEVAKWEKAAEKVWEMWYENNKNEPFDAKAELARFREIVKKTEKDPV